MSKRITISATVNAGENKAWLYYTHPTHVVKWNFASDDWHCPSAECDLRVGGTMKSRMEAKDGSFGFDFEGTYTEVVPGKKLAYTMPDDRKVTVEFEDRGDKTKITTVFDPESENPLKLQKKGWQAILDNFKKYIERN